MQTQPLRSILFAIASVSLLSGCIMTPRVDLTERIDFNYHAPAIAQPMNFSDQMCSA